MMAVWNVSSALAVNYEVKIVDGLLDDNNDVLIDSGVLKNHNTSRRLVVIDENVDAIYGGKLRGYLDGKSVEYKVIPLPATEKTKTMESVLQVVKEMDDFEITRRHEPVIAIGGGVLLDIVGLAVSLYRRSTPWVRIPTTLIGIVDAGVGAKTGVNYGQRKNRIGSYFPSKTTLLECAFLNTLDSRHIRNGMAEILKIALVKDLELFELLDAHGEGLVKDRFQGATNGEKTIADIIIERSVTGMLEELETNLWEHKLERIVDFGHTFSPEIEMRALPELLHGEAVNIDMALTTLISENRGLITTAERKRIFNLMEKLNLPVYHRECEPTALNKALSDTILHRNGLQRVPLGIGIGRSCFVNDLTEQEILQSLNLLQRIADQHQCVEFVNA